MIISTKTANYAAKELAKLFPKSDKEPEYSIGFKKWSKLTLDTKKLLMIRHSFNYNNCLKELNHAK